LSAEAEQVLSAFTMGAVDFAALAANAISFGLLWAYKLATPTCAQPGYALGMMCLAIWPCFLAQRVS
jgi:hypothetical protein